MSDNVGVLDVRSFGQPFQLGMLYDYRSHHLVTGPALWESDIKKKISFSRISPQSKYEVFPSGNVEEMAKVFGIDSNFRLSLMTGLVNPYGIVKFIIDGDLSKKNNLVRIILKYETTSRFEELRMDQAKTEPHRDLSSEMTATHFVSRIEYGREAIFVFDRRLDENETFTDVEADLKFAVDSLSQTGAESNGSAHATELDEEELCKLVCTFYEDRDQASSTGGMSYEDALRAYSELKKNEESHVYEVPKRVWLQPLSTLNPQLVRRMREVSPHVTDALQNVLANFNEFETSLCGLVDDNTCSTFPAIKQRIARCGKAVSRYKKNILKTISEMLPVVRGGDEEEQVLTDALNSVASSPFHHDRLSSWISGMKKEMKLLSMYLEFFRGIQLVTTLQDLDSVINCLEYDQVVSFSLMTAGNEDALVEQLYTFLRTGSWTPEHLSLQPWYENPEILNESKAKARNFRDFVRENEHDGRTKFIVTNVQKDTGEGVLGVRLYDGGQSTDFELPGWPGKPFATLKSASSITLQWEESPHGKETVQSYTVHFRPSVGDWKSLPTVGPENTITVDGLKAKTTYLFKVNSECKAGRSAVSATSDSVVTEDPVNQPEPDLLHKKKSESSSDKQSHSLNGAKAKDSSSSKSRDDVEGAKGGEAISGKNLENTASKLESKRTSGVWQNSKTSHDKATKFFVPYKPAEVLLPSSKKIKDGTPSIYKLPMFTRMRRQNSMITKQSIGKPPKRVKGGPSEKVLMVVGATGAGKSTLINGMVNYILGVEWKDDFRFKLIEEDKSVSQAYSQTKDITAYTIYPQKGSAIPYIFTIIDTPGFGDTEGLKRDRLIISQIKEFFSIPPPNGIDHLDAVGFVTQASLARLTPTQEYIFNSVLSIFGNDVSKNIFMMLTFADGQHPPVLEAISRANIPSGKYFKFNNSALFAKNKETEESFDAMFWKMGYLSFQNFFTEFAKAESVSLRLTKEVLNEREQLQILIEGLNPQITMGLNKIEEMRQEELVLQHHVSEIETNKDFTYEVVITKPNYIDLKGTGRHTTTCLKCNYTCHQNCMIADDSSKRGCWAMNSATGNCRICTLNCFWSNHKNLPYIIKYESVVETRTSADLQMKYERAVSGKSKIEGMIEQLEEFLQGVHSGVLTMINKAQQSLRRLDEIALKPNPLTQVQYLELVIESEKNEAKPGWKQRVEYFEEAKRHAEILSKVKDVNAGQQIIQEKARSGEKWYSRFKFW